MIKEKSAKKKNKWRKWVLWTISIPFILFFILSVAVYLPPVQRLVINVVSSQLAEATGINVTVGKVRLAFPLDLALHEVVAEDKGDTLADIQSMRLEVQMWPLFSGQVEVDGLEVNHARLNTQAWLPDLSIRGSVGHLSASSHGIDLTHNKVMLDEAVLKKADVFVALSDTAKQKAEEPAGPGWNITAGEVALQDVNMRLSLPGDSMRVALDLEKAQLQQVELDLAQGIYKVQSFGINGRSADYAVRPYNNDGRKGNTAFAASDTFLWPGFTYREQGLDPNYISLAKLGFQLENLYYGERKTEVKARLKNFYLSERSGLVIDGLSGNLSFIDEVVRLDQWKFRTPTSRLDWIASIDMKAFSKGHNNQVKLNLEGVVSAEDIQLLSQGFVDEKWMKSWPGKPLEIAARLSGNWNGVKMDTFLVDWPGVLDLSMEGEVIHPVEDSRMGDLSLNLKTQDLSFLSALLADEQGRAVVSFPATMSLSGKGQLNGSQYKAKLKGMAGKGTFTLSGGVNLDTEHYNAEVTLNQFPLHDFLPGSGMRNLTIGMKANGRSFDFMSQAAQLQAHVMLDSLDMTDWQLESIQLDADLEQGHGHVDFVSDNEVLGGEGSIEAFLGENIEMQLRSDLPNINLEKLMNLKSTLTLGTSLSLDVYSNRSFTEYGVDGDFKNIRFITADKGILARDLAFSFDTSSDTTEMWTSAGDLRMDFAAAGNITALLENMTRFAGMAQQQISDRNLSQAELKKHVPVMDLRVKAGVNNPLGTVLRNMNYTYRSLDLDLKSNPVVGIQGNLKLGAVHLDRLLLDTVTVDLIQDSTGVAATAWVKNSSKKNPHKFETKFKYYLLDAGSGVELVYYDKKGRKGIDIGVVADFLDGAMKLHMYPENPIIAYRSFQLNKDNFVLMGRDSTLSADVNLLADDGTGLRIYGTPTNSMNDITFSMNKVNLSELSQVLPFLPKLGGFLSGDFHIVDDRQSVSAMGSITADALSLEGADLGNVGMELVYMPASVEEHHANIYVSSEGKEVAALAGSYYAQGEGRFEGTAELLDFPLQLLNGFLVGTDIGMSGAAGGTLSIGTEGGKPGINGELHFKNAHLFSDVYGFNFRMDEAPVRFDSSKLVLNNFELYSNQSVNPLRLDGNLDMSDFSNIQMDFNMLARNFELINTKKKAQSLLFGKVYTNFDASLKGSLDNLSIRGKLEVLDRTDMTYILKDSPLTVDDRLHDLVQFVSFTDSVETVTESVTPSSNFDMTMSILISDAALFHCNLSEDGQNYVDLEGGGDLTLRLTQQGDMRLTGRFTANSGEMKYSLPVIPLKTFKLVSGSYVDFTGDVANPTLNIAARERVKAMVTENDQPRSVVFNVGVSITQPLDRMGLEFTIEAPEDLAVQNQLMAMTKAERGKAAVAMLATGMYLTDESMSSASSGFKASNALTAFLQSEIQNIAGSALKTIDLSIGMENSTSSTGTMTTDYSFQFAKRFWGNRISVIVGGKVSTGADAENSAESFIDNIAVEYRLDQSASRYVRVFYERSAHDPLEGQLTKTGAGLVLRRKTNKLGDLFIFRSRKANKEKVEKSEK